MIIDRGRWRDHCREHGPGFATTVHVPGLLKEPGTLEAGLRDALARATTRRGPDDVVLPRMRVYDGPRLDYHGAERVTHAGRPISSLEEWFDVVCPSQDACLAFNEADAWSPGLADLLATEISTELSDVLGEPRAGLEWYSFLGRRGYTPFGLHSDPESSMIFHLGPAPKEVWVFDRNVLAHLPNRRQITYDFVTLLPRARHIVLEPGDYLVIPEHSFHVFKNVGFAAFIGLTIFPQDVRRQLAEMVMGTMPESPGEHLSAEQAREYVATSAATVAQDNFARSVRAALDAAERRLRSVGWTRRSYVPGETLDGCDQVRVAELPVVPSGPGTPPALHVGGRIVSLPAAVDAERVASAVPLGDRLSRADLEAVLTRALPDESSSVAGELVKALARCGTVRPVRTEPA